MTNNTNEMKMIMEMLQGMQAEMNQRFDKLDSDIQEVKAEIKALSNGIGGHFEELTKNRQDSDEQLSNTIKYLVDKVFEHDMAIHTLRNKQ